ncbi:hypothetical protein M5362_11605 [Streptomyces sp. Je 1-79]|uniref:hypothetical protein n=1 Tax=Streptomyces sp. Je 1-79 TaxID=2943847 RepID=UPI0021A953BE|nr:hypothetical protein [Streptomyces sp. Je 1-79]MCT4353773.1 hypothetical protein [Streptomyces sp. Je 1-79]
MKPVFKQYTREMHKKFDYFATWQPNAALSLGDVGIVRGHQFDRITSLADMGVSFASSAAGPQSTLSYASDGQVEVSLSPEAQLPVGLGIEPALLLSVTFTRSQATYFQAVRCETRRIDDVLALEGRLRALTDSGEWRGEYTVVTELVRTGPAIILVSGRAGTRVELQVSAELAPLPQPVGAALELGTATGAESSLAARVIVPEGGLTPLFRASAMRRKALGRRRLRVRSHPVAGESEALAAPSLTPVSWDEFTREPVHKV